MYDLLISDKLHLIDISLLTYDILNSRNRGEISCFSHLRIDLPIIILLSYAMLILLLQLEKKHRLEHGYNDQGSCILQFSDLNSTRKLDQTKQPFLCYRNLVHLVLYSTRFFLFVNSFCENVNNLSYKIFCFKILTYFRQHTIFLISPIQNWQ